jgi:hypothetical protein
MPKGRRPLVALNEAEEIGKKRGKVLLLPGKRGDYFDLLLYLCLYTVHVRVKRSLTNLDDPWWILATYRRDIVRLCRVPLTGVVARELWVRSPKGSWRFFRIISDRIIEIREDGSFIEGTEYLFSLLEAPARAPNTARPAAPKFVPEPTTTAPDPSVESIP